MKINFPDWLKDFENHVIQSKRSFDPINAICSTLELTELAINMKAGGPFAASIWELNGGLIACGVNWVIPSGYSLAHAEMMAISQAQEKLGVVDLSSHSEPLVLVSSSEPCAMCYGGILWSGVKDLYYSSTKSDVESIGFKEGRKPLDWQEASEEMGVSVHPPILREKGVDLLKKYSQMGGLIYNSAHSKEK